jgi:hypothetical protein
MERTETLTLNVFDPDTPDRIDREIKDGSTIVYVWTDDSGEMTIVYRPPPSLDNT